jgi:hypothetical protein
MKACKLHRSKSVHILTAALYWHELSASVSFWIYPHGRCPQYPLDKRPGQLQSYSLCGWKLINITGGVWTVPNSKWKFFVFFFPPLSMSYLGCIFFVIDIVTINFQPIVLSVVHSEHRSLTLHLFWLDICAHRRQLAINDAKKLFRLQWAEPKKKISYWTLLS